MPKKYGVKRALEKPCEKTLDELKKEYPFRFYELRTLDGFIVYVPEGVNPDIILRDKRKVYPYSEVQAQVICERLVMGDGIMDICKERGMPSYPAICKWRRDVPEFKAMYEQAMQDRAEFHRDKALSIAKHTREEQVQSDKLKVDTHKWAAEKDNPERFGKKTKVTGEPGSVTFIVDTGISRDETEGE